MEHMPHNLEPDHAKTVEEGKTIALLAYLTIIGLIVALVMNNEKKNAFGSYHIRQSLGIMLTAFLASFIAIIPLLGWLIYLVAAPFFLVLWIFGLLNAINGKQKPIPLFGEKYAEWFKTV